MAEFKLPELGENIESADIVSVLVNEGDVVKAQQDVIEIETDKAVIAVPSDVAGKVTKIHVARGQSIKPGQVVMSIDAAAAGARRRRSHQAGQPPSNRQPRKNKPQQQSRPLQPRRRQRRQPIPLRSRQPQRQHHRKKFLPKSQRQRKRQPSAIAPRRLSEATTGTSQKPKLGRRLTNRIRMINPRR